MFLGSWVFPSHDPLKSLDNTPQELSDLVSGFFGVFFPNMTPRLDSISPVGSCQIPYNLFSYYDPLTRYHFSGVVEYPMTFFLHPLTRYHSSGVFGSPSLFSYYDPLTWLYITSQELLDIWNKRERALVTAGEKAVTLGAHLHTRPLACLPEPKGALLGKVGLY